MVNNIRLDAGSILTTKIDQKEHLSDQRSAKKEEDITVSKGLSTYISSMLEEQESSEEDLRVTAMKGKIANGDYTIDAEKLAKNLYRQIFSKIMDEK